MLFSYYPGCTLSTQAKEMDKHARLSADVLGFTLEEIGEWQCCGGVYPMGTDVIATKLSAIRALNSAKEKQQDIVTLCSACHQVLKRVNDDVRKDTELQKIVYTYDNTINYKGETNVLHFMEVLRDHVGFDKLAEKVTNPLKGRKIGAYYGCMLLRPSSIMAFDDPENPQIFESFIKALGATPIVYPRRNECCGGYISLKEKQTAQDMSAEIAKNAYQRGAEELITACPLCLYSVSNASAAAGAACAPEIYYFTKLLAEALGVLEE